jgi:metallo-beta-lactamase family protein
MEIKLTFLGAAGNVTGSRYLLQANGINVLIDCGLYQERQFAARNWDPFPFPPKDINAIILTHAHLDHCGFLPKLVKEGFSGPIYCTQATAEIAKIILLDAAKLQEEDAEHKSRRHKKEGRTGPYPEVPLYTTEDAKNVFPLFRPTPYRESFNLANGKAVEATLYDAGHVLGSSVIRVKVRQKDGKRIIIFSSDIGRPDRPIVRDPTIFNAADYVLVESTYGDRIHHNSEDIKTIMSEIINTTRAAGGNIVIPSFALERSQEVLYYINQLLLDGLIKPIRIFLDSPMASKITEVFRKHADLYNSEMAELVRNHNSPFEIPTLEFAGTSAESKAINEIKEPVIIIAGSGMCTGGRIKHHLVLNITRPESTIMFVGYQAEGTLGRSIVNGDRLVRILGQEYPVRAKVVQIHGFSAHADKVELLQWLERLEVPPRGVFVVHGEEMAAKSFGQYLQQNTGWPITIPEYRQQVILN